MNKSDYAAFVYQQRSVKNFGRCIKLALDALDPYDKFEMDHVFRLAMNLHIDTAPHKADNLAKTFKLERSILKANELKDFLNRKANSFAKTETPNIETDISQPDRFKFYSLFSNNDERKEFLWKIFGVDSSKSLTLGEWLAIFAWMDSGKPSQLVYEIYLVLE